MSRLAARRRAPSAGVGAEVSLDEVRALYHAGRYAEALEAVGGPGALRALDDPAGRVLAGRLAARLGAPRLAQALFFRAHRDAPTDPEAAHLWGLTLLARRGPWHTLRWLRRLDATSPLLRGLEGRCLAALRDFERAAPLLEGAVRERPDEPWLEVERIMALLEGRDRPEEARIALEGLLTRAPGYRPALHALAQVMSGLGEPERALAVLDGGDSLGFELLSHRAELAFNVGRFEKTEADLVAAIDAASLLEPQVRSSLALRAAEAAYLQRAYRRAAGWARQGDSSRKGGAASFARRFAAALDGLEDGAALPRRCLDAVPHVRQHHETCVPASLAAVSAFHGAPVDQRAIADEITFAGTTHAAQRAWAERGGWAVRELDVTLDAARALIDAGLPIVLSTRAALSGHAQVVIGYDLAREALLVRDPACPALQEISRELLESQRWWGPRGMVLAPADRAAELAALELPGADAWELRHRLERALDAHDREDAVAALAALEGGDPRHVASARLELARYDDDTDAALEALQALLALHPDCQSLILEYGERARPRRPRDESLRYWREHLEGADPVLLESLAEELRFDPGARAEAARLLHRVLRLRPSSGMAHHVLADLEVAQAGDLETAVEQFRFAVCNSTADEHFAEAYFHHARLLGVDAEALALLERRVEEAGHRSIGPARTLVAAYTDQGRPERGVALLESLAELRPDDGHLAIAVAEAALDAGDEEAAERWLARAAERRHPPGALDRARTRLRRARGAVEEALEASARALDARPGDVSAMAAHAAILAEARGDGAALEFLAARHEAEPDLRGLVPELCIWLRDRDDERALRLLDAQLEENPHDVWSHRERSLSLSRLGRSEEALARATETTERFPEDASAWSILGGLLERAGDHARARTALRRAIELDVDEAQAIASLARLGSDPATQREDARFVLARLRERVSRGAGLVEGAFVARVLEPLERRERLAELLERCGHRPDAWEAVAQAELEAGDHVDALGRLDAALERFPRWSRLHALRARALRMLVRAEEEEAAWRAAVETAPSSTEARLGLASCLERQGRREEAVATLEEATRRRPRDVDAQVELARLEAAAGRADAALERLLGLGRPAAYDLRAFQRVAALARELDRVDEVERWIEELAAAAPRSAVLPLRLAELAQEIDARVDALRRALAVDARCFEAADFLAESLSLAGRHDEALAACPPAEWVGPVPLPLRGRRAWVLAARGDVDDAIVAMERLLELDPGYAWGRRQVCDWLDRQGRASAFRQHAEALVSRDPNVALHHAYLGDACLAVDDRAAAVAAFGRAVELEPADPYALQASVDLALERGALTEARETLERAAHAARRDLVDALTVQLEVASRRPEEALSAFDRLLAQGAEQALFERAMSALEGSSVARAARRRARAALEGEATQWSEALGHAWAVVGLRHGARRALRLLARPRRLGAAGVAAATLLIEHLALQRGRLWLLWLWLGHREWVRRHDGTWAMFGFALRCLGSWRACARWLADGPRRAGVKRWMLTHLVAAYWATGRAALASDVVDAALALPPDFSHDAHAAWRAFEEALDGRAREVERELPEVRLAPAQEENALVALVRAMAGAERARGEPTMDALAAEVVEPLTEAAGWVRDRPELRAPWAAAMRQILAGRSWFQRAWLRRMVLPRP